MLPVKRQRTDEPGSSTTRPNDSVPPGQPEEPTDDPAVATPKTDFSQYLRDWQPEHGAFSPMRPELPVPFGDEHVFAEALPDLEGDDQPWLADWLATEGMTTSAGMVGAARTQMATPGVHEPQSPLPTPSLDLLRGVSPQYLGLSGHTDPHLLRHFRWDEDHQRKYFKLHFRRAALHTGLSGHVQSPDLRMQGLAVDTPLMNGTLPKPDGQNIPVQFMLPVTDITEEEKKDSTFRSESSAEDLRSELFNLINPADGLRLIQLHFRFVYPCFPAVLRRPYTSVDDLEDIPTHLLAAIYASALPFVDHDHHLFVQNVYRKAPVDEVWHIVLEEVLRESHSPHLSIIQASLLYLQKLPRSSKAGQDTPFRWSFMAGVYGLACALGLQLDCSDWLIPTWEKRLRRRLWWLVFFEEKWRCLLVGQPSLIHEDHWDVSDLRDDDFLDDFQDSDEPIGNDAMPSDEVNGCVQFRCLLNLSRIGDEIYKAFYTLRSARELQNDFSNSLHKAKPLRQRLQSWYQALPASFQMRKRRRSNETLPENEVSPAAIHLAYLSLELLLYRAILRPLGKFRKTGNPGAAATTLIHDDTSPTTVGTWPDAHAGNLKEAMEATYAAAHNCARLWNTFAATLDANDFGSFWYSWSRIGFAHQSNFVALLIAQAPTDELRQDAMKVADTWRNTLRVQSKSFDQMSLGLLRLEVMYWVGFDQLFEEERQDIPLNSHSGPT
ncbi:uncharacterized protein HMPREF1541_08990 [Cyphellophora europaea CBS 101466]|uniref:Xylanolytic transcriptional activator regulatory domain-containing protein n=1 Tax=Cyphellophora europaea (strain CBS 101466) TaxID=1220924 RepID=W2RJN9_CYPE1|nr:uncharacterized protein HMPREF1541_08990 [Cyphellophora europaea CBS 101466]ETN36712.1 hypothetical protein HMPREF1541_08990 [Cyphellophora europaea CBS 101466]